MQSTTITVFRAREILAQCLRDADMAPDALTLKATQKLERLCDGDTHRLIMLFGASCVVCALSGTRRITVQHVEEAIVHLTAARTDEVDLSGIKRQHSGQASGLATTSLASAPPNSGETGMGVTLAVSITADAAEQTGPAAGCSRPDPAAPTTPPHITTIIADKTASFSRVGEFASEAPTFYRDAASHPQAPQPPRRRSTAWDHLTRPTDLLDVQRVARAKQRQRLKWAVLTLGACCAVGLAVTAPSIPSVQERLVSADKLARHFADRALMSIARRINTTIWGNHADSHSPPGNSQPDRVSFTGPGSPGVTVAAMKAQFKHPTLVADADADAFSASR